MSKKQKSNWVQRFSVKAKILAPVGITLSQGETIALADIYDEDVKKIKKNQQEVVAAVGATVYKDNERAIDKSLTARNTAAGIYKRTADPIKKREWAQTDGCCRPHTESYARYEKANDYRPRQVRHD